MTADDSRRSVFVEFVRTHHSELSLSSREVERQMLITFFRFCVSRKWMSMNPAKELKRCYINRGVGNMAIFDCRFIGPTASAYAHP
jgi:hypothetical protein